MVSKTQADRQAGSAANETEVSQLTDDVDRAQTTIDFTIGISIFLVVLAAVFLFVPGTLQPFTQGGQEDIVSVNRVTDDLAEQSLAENGTPHILNGTCTNAFFDSTDSSCDFGGTVQENTGVRDLKQINVTIQGNVSPRSGTTKILCYDASEDPGDKLENPSCSGTRLAIGNRAAETGSSVTSRRVVELDGFDVFLVVRVW